MDRRNRRLPDILFQLQGQAVYPHNRLCTKNHIRENVRRLKDMQTTARQQKKENEKKVPLKATVRYANVQSKVGQFIKDPKLSLTKRSTEEVAEKVQDDDGNKELVDVEGARVPSAHSDYSSLDASLSPTAVREDKDSPRFVGDDEIEAIFVEGTKLKGVEVPTPRKNESVLINTESGIMPREDASSSGRMSRRDVLQYSRQPRSASHGRISSGRLTQTQPPRSASSGRSTNKMYSIANTNKMYGVTNNNKIYSSYGKLNKQQSMEKKARPKSLERTKPLPKQNTQNFKKQNADAVKSLSKANEKLKKSGGNVVPNNYKKGAVPKYLRERQEQWKQEEDKKLYEKKMGIPPGHIMMPEQERTQTLKLLEERRDELTRELTMLPIRNDTLRLQNKRSEIHSELQRLDEGIHIFSRPKVFVKQTP